MMKLTKREIFWLAHKYAKRYVRYINGETKVMEVGKEYDSSFFTIDEQGRFLQCEWNGTLRKKQYFNY